MHRSIAYKLTAPAHRAPTRTWHQEFKMMVPYWRRAASPVWDTTMTYAGRQATHELINTAERFEKEAIDLSKKAAIDRLVVKIKP